MARNAVGLVIVSAALLSVRLVAAGRVGFGDSEALYATYALHPAPAYLDHPGLIGLFARWIGGGAAPTPARAHLITSLVATAVPWLALAAARGAGAGWAGVGATLAGRRGGGAWAAGLIVAVVPEMAIGLFAMTPDLLLAVAWLVTLGGASMALRSPPASGLAAMGFVLGGVAAGLGGAAKVTGLFLVVALIAAYASRGARRHARTIWPWMGIALAIAILAPVATFEAQRGWPMLAHRLVATQRGAGVTMRNLGAVLGGQLLYLSPLLAFAAVVTSRDLARRFWPRGSRLGARIAPSSDEGARDAVTVLLFASWLVPVLALLPLCLWSRVAEPHWLAPPLLSLVLVHARDGAPESLGRRFGRAAFGVAASFAIAVHAWVLFPALARLAPRDADPKLDLANELFGWNAAVAAARSMAKADSSDSLDGVVFVGPTWMICAQLSAALGAGVRVGCMTDIPDDFDDWEPRAGWSKAERVLFVTDNRFPRDVASLFTERAIAATERVVTYRGGRLARTFSLSLLERAARTERAPSPRGPRRGGAPDRTPPPGWAW